jgi:predicted Zn finger-like uncharacterized protein
MIIACPACSTRYVVPDSAIGVDGRTVRCAKCRHSWFQDGPATAAPLPPETPSDAPVAAPVSAPASVPPPAPEPAAPEPVAQPEPIAQPERVTQPEPETETAAPPVESTAEPEAPPPLPMLGEEASPPAVYADEGVDRYQDEGRSSFDFEPPFKPRRNRVRMWTLAALLFALVSLAAVVAVGRYGLPDWVPMARATFAEAQPDLVLDFPPNRQDRRTLPNGAEYFGASGTITNVGQSRRSVPTILIVLRDSRERIVYSWEVAPPKSTLAPGESVTINEAVTDVPKRASIAEIGWKPG